MSRGKEAVRRAALGANRGFKVLNGGKGRTPDSTAEDEERCPVAPLGHNKGTYYFLDPAGQFREMTARQMGSRHDLMGLFLGDDTWLRSKFPHQKQFENAEGQKEWVTVDFKLNEAAKWLIAAASAKGLWGERTRLRKPGIWRGEDGRPVIHCGDAALVGDEWLPAGARTGNQIWAAAEATPRPDIPCDHRIAQQIQKSLQEYWKYQNEAGPIAILGLLYSGYLCGALNWRCNGFVTGGSGSGKTALCRVVQRAWPVHDYSNDTSKAGMEQTVASRAIPAIIDESNDRNKSSGRDLIDIVLSASGDQGTKLSRGTADGKGRQSEVISSVVMFSINPPELEAQHLNRFVMIELVKPQGGDDFSAEHRQIADFVQKHATALWARAIAAFDRYSDALLKFRVALRDRGCDPREMDGKGSLLAGWFVLTHEGLPDEDDLRRGVEALGDFIVTSKEAAMDDGPRRMLQHLLSSLVTLHRSTDRDPIGVLLDQAFGLVDDATHTPAGAARILTNYGIRPVRKCSTPPDRRGPFQCQCAQCWDVSSGRAVPRLSREDGLWFSPSTKALNDLFERTPFDGGRWKHELKRLPTAQRSKGTVRVGGSSERAIWLERSDLHLAEGL